MHIDVREREGESGGKRGRAREKESERDDGRRARG